jgi:hypothetical protein
MSFTDALQTAITLTHEYNNLGGQLSAAAVASDHDPNWGETDELEFKQLESRKREVARGMRDQFELLATAHPKAWQGYLLIGIERMRALAPHEGKNLVYSDYAREKWEAWTAGTLPPADQPEIFARGYSVLVNHAALIDQLIGR